MIEIKYKTQDDNKYRSMPDDTPILPDHFKFFTFRVDGVEYDQKTSEFDLAAAPYILWDILQS